MHKGSKPKISVIMSVFNPIEKSYLFQAVHSIIQQTFQDWELILYDDGSEKNCAKMIQEIGKLDHRIFCVRNSQNLGLSHALNECIRLASGNYIARMDADDWSRIDRLQKQYVFLKSSPQYQWVGSNAELMDQSGVWGVQKMPEIPKKTDFLWNSPYIHPSVTFRRDTLIQNMGYSTSPVNLQCEDYELFIRLHKNGCQGYNIQEPLLQYREDKESVKKRTYQRRIREMKVRYHGFHDLGILNCSTFLYVLKPLAVGAIPKSLYRQIRKQTKH